MSLTPLDILHREFRRAFRGYHDGEVQEFLRQVSGDYEKLVGENARMKDEVETLKQRLAHYDRIEETMQNALVVAQKTAEETKHAADKRAELILADANQKSRVIVDAAHFKVASLEAQVGELRQKRRRFELEFTSLLDMYREMLKDAPGAIPPVAENPGQNDLDVPPIVQAGQREAAAEPAAPLGVSPSESGNGNGHVLEDEITSPRHKLIDWHLIGTHAEADA